MRSAPQSMSWGQRVLLVLGILWAASWAAAAGNSPWHRAPELLQRLQLAPALQISKGVVKVPDKNLKTALQQALGIHTDPTADALADRSGYLDSASGASGQKSASSTCPAVHGQTCGNVARGRPVSSLASTRALT